MRLATALIAALGSLSVAAHAEVIMSASPDAPVTDAIDQFTLLDDATVPGGTTPLGGTYNSQAYSDNAGPPGQTFTTPAGSLYFLDAFLLKGVADGGGGVFGANWGIRVSSVTGTALTPLLTLTNVAAPTGTITGVNWFKWTFTGEERLTLQPSTTYAVEVYSSAGWQGFDAATDPNSYAGGFAFNSAGAARGFASTTIQDRGYDRTFVADLTAVPEPGSAVMLLSGIAFLARRRRR